MIQIENYKIIPIGGCRKNLSGQQFGDYKVLYRTEPSNPNSGHAYWLCQCVKCNKYFTKTTSTLTKGKNICDCKYDLSGKTIGRWSVKYLCEKRTKKQGKIYHCECECGNEKDVPAEALRKGESQSCGCLHKEISSQIGKRSRIDLTGQRFGKLIALYPIYRERNRHTLWCCRCDCGNICNIDMGNLRQGFSQSCGCVRSKNEENIIKLLAHNKISFEYQKRFDNLKTKSFDFFVDNKYILEFDGKQHFSFLTNVKTWNTEENYKALHRSDLLKNKYCFENNIPLIRIPYDVEYTFDDLVLETTRFLLTPENEKEYYSTRSKSL